VSQGSGDEEPIGVVGAGVMGVGVAQAVAQSGRGAILLDVAGEKLEAARAEIGRNLRFRGLFGKEAAPEAPEAVLARISFTLDPAALAGTGFVVENVPERWAVKEEVYRRIDGICPERTIFASNTSAIPIARIASVTGRPDRVVGTHFMNPVPLVDTVEVVRAPETSEETLERTREVVRSLGKEAVVVRDSPGFATNRVLRLTVNEAMRLVEEGVAPPEDVDRIFCRCFGHRMGPIRTADMIGLDTALCSLEVREEHTGDAKLRPCDLLREHVEAGRHGRKTGEGFFRYGTGGRER